MGIGLIIPYLCQWTEFQDSNCEVRSEGGCVKIEGKGKIIVWWMALYDSFCGPSFVNFVAVLLFFFRSFLTISFMAIDFFSIVAVVILQQGVTRVSMAQFVFPDDDPQVSHLLPVSSYC